MVEGAPPPSVSHRYAKVPHLWALGVGSVIAGNYYGWQATLIAGFNGMLIITAFVTVLYVLLAFSVAEMAAMLPTGGGPYVFTLHGIGPRAAFFAGVAETIKIVVTVGTSFYMIFLYLDALFGLDADYSPLWWILFAGLFIGLNVLGIQVMFRVQVVATLLCVLVLVVFYVGAATKLDYNKWVVQQDMTYSSWSDSIQGISFALWFYFGIEELPLAVEETINPEKNIPRGLAVSMLTLIVLAFSTITFSCLIDPGAAGMYEAAAPLVVGYRSVFGDTTTTSYFTWITVVGIITSTYTFVFYMGRLLFAIARDGYFPQFLAKENPTNGTPYMALITGGAVALLVDIVLYYTIGDVHLGAVVINLALIGGLVSYILQLVSFIRLRLYHPELPRPYRSPFGVAGAVLCLAMCAIVLASIVYSGISGSDFLASVVGAIVIFALSTIYFFHTVKPRLERRHASATPSHVKLRESLLSVASINA